MTTLYEAERHEKLIDRAWDESAARAAIQRIVGDTEAAFTPEIAWPVHEQDEPRDQKSFYNIYFGAAGVVWALDYLNRVGACERQHAFGSYIADWFAPNSAQMGFMQNPPRALLMGDTGLLLAQYRNAPFAQIADALHESVAANTDNPAREYMWGSPGTMVVAAALLEETGDTRWRDVVRASADDLERTFVAADDRRYRLWQQDLYGQKLHFIGAVHGFAGNAYALIRTRKHLEPAQWARLSPALAETLAQTAVRTDAGVNWRSATGPTRPGRPEFLVQHCHGAPGMTVALAELPEPIDDLLVAAGETTWRAGPLAKGSNLCHGTGGNGYAFLKLFKRTGDQKWLDRARAFAVHAIAQCDADAEQYGMRRYSLWTGDLGLACYLWDCVRGEAAFPTMDVV